MFFTDDNDDDDDIGVMDDYPKEKLYQVINVVAL